MSTSTNASKYLLIAIAVLAVLLLIALAVLNNFAGTKKQQAAEITTLSSENTTLKANQAASEKALNDAQARANDSSKAYEQTKTEQQAKSQVVYQTVEKIVDRPVYHNECIDADGLSAIASAINGHHLYSPDSSQSSDSVPSGGKS